MFNQTRPPLLPRFVAAVTVGALFSANIAPAFAADPAAPAKEKAAAPAKPEAKPAETKPAADAKAAPVPKADAKPADAKPADAKEAKAAAAKPADKPKPPDKKTKDAARKAYSEGEKAYAAGDFTAALAGFTKANELVPAPQAAYWAAKSIDGQGKIEDAIAAYEKLLADPNISSLGDEKTNDAKQRVTDLKAKLVGEVNLVTTPIGATVSIDGTPQAGETPMIVKLPPGPHKLSLMAPGYEPKDVDIDVKGGEKAEQKLELTAKAPPPPPPPEPVVEAPAPPPPPPPPPPRSKVPAYITLGIAGAGAVVGTIFGIKALGAKNDFDKQPTGTAADDTERNALIADMAFGVAITLGVTGVVLLTSDDSTAPAAAAKLEKLPKRAKLVVAPYASPKGGGAGMQYSF
ncbi:MAG TPA: PEGA domain-containing protein [Polyangiaceae bacterium]|nr:PEGA domain-containing protein [Polyangiaceae bacterium]